MSTQSGEILLSSKDAELVRWCEPYACTILQHQIKNEQKTLISCVSEANRRIVVNWICNVARREQFKSETFWSAISTFDRYCATLKAECDSDEMQCIAAACIQLAATYQETALSPTLEDFVEMCGNRYKKERLRAICWKITAALSADLYWPSPITFYRHFSQAMRQTSLEHTMTKFVVESISFARDSILAVYLPSTIACCSLIVAHCCIYNQFPSRDWFVDWKERCLFPCFSDENKKIIVDCTSAIADFMSKLLSPTDLSIARELESVLRRYSHEQLFKVAKIAQLPADAALQVVREINNRI